MGKFLDSNQPLAGFRCWSLNKENSLELLSTDGGYVWLPGSNTASCLLNDTSSEPVPHIEQGCHCGFNAFFSFDDAVSYSRINNFVLGVILGAGKVAIHDTGFRSEKAQILGLIEFNETYRQENPFQRELNFANSEVVKKIAKIYGARLTGSPKELVSLAESYGLCLSDPPATSPLSTI